MKTNSKSTLLALLIMAQIAFSQTPIWNGTADTTWYTNNKNLNEYTITTAEQLAGLALLVNGGTENGTYNMSGRTITLGNDIVLNDTTDWQNWDENTQGLNQWTAIGTSEGISFQGIFDGNEHVISGIYVNTDANNQGLFGVANVSSTIKHIGVEASYIKGGTYVGGLVGDNDDNKSIISNSYVIGTISGTRYVGGLAGISAGTISNSYAAGTVSGTSRVGGLVGDGWGPISNSYATGAVSGSSSVGGLVGYNHYIVSNSYATGMVSGTGDNIGGLVGNCICVIRNSQATGAVSGIGNNVGGLLGNINGANSGVIEKSYAIGTVSGTGSDVGGLIGNATGHTYDMFFNIYYDIQTSGQSDEGKGEGKTTEEMKTQSTYVNWNFSDTWGMSEETNNGYPYLLWADTYNIAYNANGGTDAPEAQVKVKGIALILRGSISTKENYTFTSWNTKADGTGTDYTAGGSYSIDAEHTLYAQWALNTYTVKFVDHDETELKIEYVEHGSSATAPEYPTRTGYTFTGWDTEFDEITSNLTVTAIYAISTYTVKFIDHDETELKIEYVEHGSSATAPEYPTRTGYTFAGWDSEFDEITGNLTVTAIYAINTYTVTFVDHDGTVLKIEYVKHGSNAVSPIDPERDGYTFTGWDAEFDEVTGNITVTATYTQQTPIPVTYAIITIPANSGGSVEGSGTYEHETNIIVTATANDGYEFVNWTENGVEVSTNAIYQFTATENRILVANFEIQFIPINTLQIIAIPANAGGSVEGSGTYEHGESITVTAIANEDYKFVNWTENGVEVSTEENYQFTATENRILVANFEAQSTPINPQQIAGGQINVLAINGGIFLENLPSNAKVELYNLQGKLVYSAISVETQCIVPLQTKGVYIVKIGSKTFKVVK